MENIGLLGQKKEDEERKERKKKTSPLPRRRIEPSTIDRSIDRMMDRSGTYVRYISKHKKYKAGMGIPSLLKSGRLVGAPRRKRRRTGRCVVIYPTRVFYTKPYHPSYVQGFGLTPNQETELGAAPSGGTSRVERGNLFVGVFRTKRVPTSPASYSALPGRLWECPSGEIYEAEVASGLSRAEGDDGDDGDVSFPASLARRSDPAFATATSDVGGADANGEHSPRPTLVSPPAQSSASRLYDRGVSVRLSACVATWSTSVRNSRAPDRTTEEIGDHYNQPCREEREHRSVSGDVT